MTHSYADDLSVLFAALEKPQSSEQLSKTLKLEASEVDKLLKDLVNQGRILVLEDGRYRKPSGKVAVGYISQRRHGRFVLMPDERSLPFIKIPDSSINGAVAGDRVLVQYTSRQQMKSKQRSKMFNDDRLSGKVLSIIERRPNEVVGVYSSDNFGNERVVFHGRDKPSFAALQGQPELEQGQIIRVKLSRSRHGRTPVAHFVASVSDLRSPQDDVESIAALYEFPIEFSGAALSELDTLPDHPSQEDIQERLDLRNELVITIDPADAKDHDDAFSLEVLSGGRYRLGVHIADVSHYVRPGTQLNREAAERGTSVYLPGKTIPMLPEKLSAGLCSLMDGHDRLAKSCYITFDSKAKVLRREVYRSVVNVKKFFNYKQALGILEGDESFGEDFTSLMLNARKLADAIQEKRRQAGSLSLNITRPHLVVNDQGEIVEIQVDQQDRAHNLIEEFMIAANQAVAGFMIDLDMPYLGRVHPSPEEQADEDFAEFCEELGIAAPNFGDSRRVQLFLDGLKDAEGESAIHLAVLKSLKRAEYSPQAALHYALATKRYTHFTSPIRRLCDTVVHQILDAYWDAGGVLKSEDQPQSDLTWVDGKTLGSEYTPLPGNALRGARNWRMLMPSIARHASETNVRAERAELQCTLLKLLRRLEDNVGEEFDGHVVHIGSSGVHVQLDDVWAEGSILFADLSLEWVETHKFWALFDTKDGMQKLRVGDRVRVKIKEVNVAERDLRLTLVATEKKAGSGSSTAHLKNKLKRKAKKSAAAGKRGNKGGKRGRKRSSNQKRRKR